MFSLLYGFWRYLFQKDEYYVLILGLDNAGKTTFLEQTKTNFNPNYKGVNLSKISCTVGLNIGKIVTQSIVLNFWDLGGQQELQCLWDKYYAEAHGIIFIVDSSDIERIDDAKNAFEKMINNEAVQGLPLMFVANKQDIPNCLSLARILEIFELSRFTTKTPSSLQEQHLQHRDFYFTGVSALTGNGIAESIDWITTTVKKNNLVKPPINAEKD